MENKVLKYSSSPHIKKPRTTKQIMLHVCIALLPSAVMGVVFFGLNALWLILISVASAILSEFIFYLIAGKSIKEIAKQFDFSSLVTGLLIGLVIGSQTPLYVPIFANAFAIIVVKLLFGGTGNNLVNPAVTGRIFAFMSFTAVMAGGWIAPSILSLTGESSISATTGATVLTDLLSNKTLPNLSTLDLFLGTGVYGCIGETCKLALLVGAIYLAVLGIINIGYPIIYIVVTGLFTVCLNGFDFAYFLPSILSGGLILGAFFMATDYTTTPNTTLGNIVYFALLGLLTAILRQATGIEVVSFAILFMNILLPLIEKIFINKPFGFVKEDKGGNK